MAGNVWRSLLRLEGRGRLGFVQDLHTGDGMLVIRGIRGLRARRSARMACITFTASLEGPSSYHFSFVRRKSGQKLAPVRKELLIPRIHGSRGDHVSIRNQANLGKGGAKAQRVPCDTRGSQICQKKNPLNNKRHSAASIENQHRKMEFPPPPIQVHTLTCPPCGG